ncbi:uncharacterized protein ATNIH1004_000265 [Aspergillus tanneri]|uniref:FAD-binding domain-containing protein n=1 Tax=Aspergillus tanneri TaxID=1220188 RepID=A0A5M9N2G7_9EURO|nr:uncharacterized protein ATNIH1004_000265 [Aspergillus tanneri]KAA8651383.1 hypothetical protein ATNIH1004_000265 [Aspergillus tanneri]
MMGDATHATSPFQGAGAGQAIGDALVLLTLFLPVTTQAQIKPTLTAYDSVKRLRSQKVVATSRGALKLFCFNDGYVKGDRQRWKKTWDGRMDWLRGVDLLKQDEEALNAYGNSIKRQPSASKGML